jgi:5-hydroxyisourate hydrolase
MKTPITTHILDLHLGKPAAGVLVTLSSASDPNRQLQAKTDSDGRVGDWSDSFVLTTDVWELRFQIDDWARGNGRSSFFSTINLRFKVENDKEHYHVPLLLNEFGYTTYRGS